jgi:hypothetical protein
MRKLRGRKAGREKRAVIPRRKGGRPELDINTDLVEAFAASGFTYEEIAAKLNCSAKTLQTKYREHIERGYLLGRGDLKYTFKRVAMKGNVTALIFLAKQKRGIGLSMTDESTSILQGPDGLPLKPPPINLYFVSGPGGDEKADLESDNDGPEPETKPGKLLEAEVVTAES